MTSTAKIKVVLSVCLSLILGGFLYCVISSPGGFLEGWKYLLVGFLLFGLSISVNALLLKDESLVVGLVSLVGFVLMLLGLAPITNPIWLRFISPDRQPFVALVNGNSRALSRMLEKDPALANKPHPVGSDTLLHLAAASKQTVMAEMLLAKGANVNALNKENETPLDVAIREGNPKVARILEEHGALRASASKGPSSSEGTTSPQEKVGTGHFDRWGLSFDLPQDWQEFPAEKVESMKGLLQEEIKKSPGEPERQLADFTVFSVGNQQVALLVSRTELKGPLSIGQLLEERRGVYRDAQKAGEVTEVNRLEEFVVAGNPALLEEVTRTGGQRGRTVKILLGKAIFELSLVPAGGGSIADYEPQWKTVMETLKIAPKSQ
jgi:hypothetical protein